jgi:putative heme-binding domain-containing protein
MRIVAFPAILSGLLVVAARFAASQDLARGKLLFESQCSRCHGITGAGAMGPSLRRPTLRQAPDDSAFVLLLTNGLPERGMPAAWQLGAAEIRDLIGYARSLGRIASAPLAGDSTRGRAIYESKGACATCHLINGVGGALGPELTLIGLTRGAEHLRQAIVSPGAVLPMGPQTNYPPGQFARYLPVRAVRRGGDEVAGLRVNEDRFTIQVRTRSGELHSVSKLALDTLDKRFGESLMPAYDAALSAREVDDLVAFLASLRGPPPAAGPSRPVP